MAELERVEGLLASGPRVVNIGLSGFADDLRASGVPVVHVEWSPPAGGDKDMIDLLDKLGM